LIKKHLQTYQQVKIRINPDYTNLDGGSFGLFFARSNKKMGSWNPQDDYAQNVHAIGNQLCAILFEKGKGLDTNGNHQ
jgi:hypothetical protein